MPEAHKVLTYDNDVVCPHCGAQLQASTGALTEDKGPQDGDISLCADCAELSFFKMQPTLHLVKPSDGELYRYYATLSPEDHEILQRHRKFVQGLVVEKRKKSGRVL
jgi:hypothetical protein